MNRIILTPVLRAFIRSLRGKYKGKGLLAALAAEKKCERDCRARPWKRMNP